uniref:Membrane protein, palmitoylated 4-like n=1 Tax=Pygocentrus nattereri TaxID=42514 RepID=A0AAR2KVF8_PYGNA
MRQICGGRGLGATIRRDETTGEIYVARVIHGGLADRSGLLHAGDRLVEVNGHPVFGLEPEQIIQILAHSHGTVMFKVVPITNRPVNNQTMLYVRALVDYSPQQDPAIPCADAGMVFRRGDLLEIVDQTDALWWQAKKLPCSSACAGLIPSSSLLKRKQREFWWSQPYQPHTCIKTCKVHSGGSGLSCSLRCPSSCYSALANPYEEVVRYQRHPEDTHRLIALLGPSGVGVNELRRRLIEINPKTYQGATPHTTRPLKSHEEPGREYHFINRDQFENMAYNQCFIEYGEYRGHFYGTSVEAVKDVLTAGKICIIDIEPYAIDAVRTHELRAYVIYIKPPPLDQMKRTRVNSQLITSYYTTRSFKDEDFQEIEEAGRKMEQHYGQFFDHVIVNDGLQASCVQLLTAIRRAQDEPQWVPVSWIRPTVQF